MKYVKSLLFTACTLLMLAACTNDTLKDDIDDLKNRVELLEAQVGLLNDNMTAIKVLLEGGKTITDLKQNNGTYTLTLSNGETISLTQGTKGEVVLPTITVDPTTGYWMVNGETLKQNGQPVSATGAPGSNGATPKFRISTEGSFWQISYDNGANWEFVYDENNQKVSAVGNGSGGGAATDNFFEDVKVSDDGAFFMVKLKDTQEYISVPIVQDILCQIILPQGTLQNGFWEVGYGKTVTATVKVKGDHIITTAPAGWTVTVSEPNADTHEATLTITAPASKPISRATADNSCDVTVQVNKGAAWTVEKIQVKAIEVIDSYFALYTNGQTFTVNGISVNQATFGEARYIDTDTNITSEGVYFIKPGVTATYTGTGNCQQLILIGDNSEARSTVDVNAQIKLTQTTVDGYFLCKNITLRGTATLNNQLFTYNTDNVPFHQVAFDQCELITSPGKHVLYLATNARSIENFTMENSLFKSEATNQKYIISLGSSTNEGYANIVFRNNVFYCPSGKVNQFGLFNGQNAGITHVTLENNTFVNLETSTTSMVYVKNLGTVSVKNNLFWSNTAGANNCVIFRPTTNKPTGTTCKENIVYKTMTYAWNMFFDTSTSFEGLENLKIVTDNPFEGGTFDLDNGKFVPNATYADYGASIY